MKKIPIRTKSFSRLVEGNYYFVDKTLMIKEFLNRVTDVTLITRPRRFGKTINMSMMAEFFDITKDSIVLFYFYYFIFVSYPSAFSTLLCPD